MVSLLSLWLPILLSAVFVFIISSFIHMVLGYHRNDFVKVPGEDKVMDDLRAANIPPGDYMLPYAATPKELSAPEYVEKMKKGPAVVMTVLPSGQSGMGKNLVLWFIFSLIISVIAAYVASRALGLGAHYLQVFRFAGVAAFAGYSLALMQNSIWFGRSWMSTLKSMFDGLIFALVTAGTFGWLWPA